MYSEMTLPQAEQFVDGREPIPTQTHLDVLYNNTNELKILAQSPQDGGVPVLVSEARSTLVGSTECNNLQTVSPGHFIRVLKSMNDRFVIVEGERGSLTVASTTEGNMSAAFAGHMGAMALTTNVSVRGLMGEGLGPRELPGKKAAGGNVEIRLGVLNILFETTSSAEWQSASDLLVIARDRGIEERVFRSHLTKLRAAGILERRDPNRRLLVERQIQGYFYRLKQENGLVPPVEVVERYLALVKLATVMDEDFIAEGLYCLGEISQNRTYVAYLLRRAAANTGHTGKKYPGRSKKADEA